MDHVVLDQKQCKLASLQMSILNSRILSNTVASNSQSLKRHRRHLSYVRTERGARVYSAAGNMTVWAEKHACYSLCSLETYFWHL